MSTEAAIKKLEEMTGVCSPVCHHQGGEWVVTFARLTGLQPISVSTHRGVAPDLATAVERALKGITS